MNFDNENILNVDIVVQGFYEIKNVVATGFCNEKEIEFTLTPAVA